MVLHYQKIIQLLALILKFDKEKMTKFYDWLFRQPDKAKALADAAVKAEDRDEKG